jgi:hypothetical protein
MLTRVFLALFFALRMNAATSDRIEAVENGLIPAVIIKGRPIQRASITERMKVLKIRGVSIAIINNYEIEWAKAYGWALST